MRDDTVFAVHVESWTEMSLRDLWPDGNAPENPTADDVVEMIKRDVRDGDHMVREWFLNPIEVSVEDLRNGTPGPRKVEWPS